MLGTVGYLDALNPPNIIQYRLRVWLYQMFCPFLPPLMFLATSQPRFFTISYMMAPSFPRLPREIRPAHGMTGYFVPSQGAQNLAIYHPSPSGNPRSTPSSPGSTVPFQPAQLELQFRHTIYEPISSSPGKLHNIHGSSRLLRRSFARETAFLFS